MSKRFFSIGLILFVIFSLCACDGADRKGFETEVDEITVHADKTQYDLDNPIVTLTIKNNSNKEYGYSKELFFEVKENGNYKSIEKDEFNNAIIALLEPQSETVEKINIKERFSDVKAGDYRIGYCFFQDQPNQGVVYYAEFSLS